MLLTSSGLLHAATVELPLFLRLQILQNALERSLNLQPDGRAILYQNDSYNFLHISEPTLYIRDGKVRFRCNASAGAGIKSFDILPSSVGWNGTIDLNLIFYVDDQWQLRYRIADSVILDQDGSEALVTSFIWFLSKSHLYPILEDFAFDLTMPRKEIQALLRACASPEDTQAIENMLDTVRPGSLLADDRGIVVPLLFSVGDREAKKMVLPEAQKPLTEEELQAFQQVFEPLDAFLVFVVKTVGADFVGVRQREQLFELLISSRYQILSILSGEVPVDTEDPLRRLFVDAWQKLKIVIESGGSQNSLMQEQLLRYMTFINAGDALLVLDTAAPQLGMQISTDGLRRLARMLKPDSVEDPLQFDWQVDPALRELFNFIPETRERKPAIGHFLLDMLFKTAYAANAPAGVTAPPKQRLDPWVPGSGELEEYRSLIARLLQTEALEQIRAASLDDSWSKVFQHLVPATALMESCWRQYVIKGEKIVFLRSRSGSIGIMQVNQHVWRGFYSIDRLKWDVVYNIRAGTEILMHYFKDYGLKVAGKNGKSEYAARSAYSAYNAGPQAARRFMDKNATAREKQVDSRLWGYYQAISSGGIVNLAVCNVDKKPT